MGLSEAAALLHDGLTALALFEGTSIGSEDVVLVVGASGGLGIASVQLARARAARVVAVAREEGKLARIRQIGADAVIDSETPDWVDQARRRVTVRGIRDVQLDDHDIERLTEQALAEGAAGHLRPVIGQTFPLSQAAAAHAAIEARTVFGKTLILP